MSVTHAIEKIARAQGVDAAQLAQAVVEQQDDAVWTAWSRICGLAGDDEPAPATTDPLGDAWLRAST